MSRLKQVSDPLANEDSQERGLRILGSLIARRLSKLHRNSEIQNSNQNSIYLPEQRIKHEELR